ncbi:MAG: hypothetical protein WA884_04585 [Methyloceanibacter sp.]
MITLGYPAFFGTPNLVAQTTMTAAMAALVAIALLPALLLDYPFTGEVRISAAPFDQALQQIPPHAKGRRARRIRAPVTDNGVVRPQGRSAAQRDPQSVSS